jgi:hypothetical protein
MTLKGDPAEVQRVFEEIKGLPGTGNDLMDLNSIVPMPEVITRILELSHIDVIRRAVKNQRKFAEYQKRKDAERSAAWLETGFEGWSDWAQTEWGSKFNVYFVEYDANEANTMYFSSAWSPIIPALLALSAAFPTVTIEIAFADEGAYYIGKGKLKAGKKYLKTYAIKSREGREIFERFWGEWYGPEEDEDKDDQDFIDLTHKAAS